MDLLRDHEYSRKWYNNPKYCVAEPMRFYDCTTRQERYVMRECEWRSNASISGTELDLSDWNEPAPIQLAEFHYCAPFIKCWLQLFDKLHLEEASEDWRDQMDAPYFRAKAGCTYFLTVLTSFDNLRLQFSCLRQASSSAYLELVEQLSDTILSACTLLGWDTTQITEGHFLTISTLPIWHVALYFDAVRHLRASSASMDRLVESLLIGPLTRKRLVGVPIARRGWPLADASCIVDMLRSHIEVFSEVQTTGGATGAVGDIDHELARAVMSELDSLRRFLTLADPEHARNAKRERAGPTSGPAGGTSIIFLSVGVLYSPHADSNSSMSNEDVQRIAFFGKRLKAVGRVMHLCVPEAPLSEMVNLVVEKVRTLKAREVRTRDEKREPVESDAANAANTGSEASTQKTKKRPVRVVLLGWELGALLACYASLFEKIDGLVCIGLPIVSVNRKRIHGDDLLALISSPILFAVGAQSRTCPVGELERFRESVVARSRAVIFHHAIDYLRVADTFESERPRSLRGARVSQAAIDAKLLCELCNFLKQVVLPNAATKPTLPSVHDEQSKPEDSDLVASESTSETPPKQLAKRDARSLSSQFDVPASGSNADVDYCETQKNKSPSGQLKRKFRNICMSDEMKRKRMLELEAIIEASVRVSSDNDPDGDVSMKLAPPNRGDTKRRSAPLKGKRRRKSAAARRSEAAKHSRAKTGLSLSGIDVEVERETAAAELASAAAMYSVIEDSATDVDAIEKAALAILNDVGVVENEDLVCSPDTARFLSAIASPSTGATYECLNSPTAIQLENYVSTTPTFTDYPQ